ncbi:hypothetical protein F3Y22_tig00112349pilonHSYRG00151 [Hibiscus syriacus]|uniref:Translocase of chloroplast 159/132 membrane anchor domain-containing protein n=1 Tax=Hibiscus syriacus TaxID=106335 RepID=A0A6A2XM09_HIBSY|nr:hypothetical protein F3Y22_tig00112349pilonHSYRG00151 [Hibiscus syriacus]
MSADVVRRLQTFYLCKNKHHLSKEQRKAYHEDDNNGYVGDYGNTEDGDPATIQVPLPDMVLHPSFDRDHRTYRYRFLDSASQLLTRPVLDPHPWDRDIGIKENSKSIWIPQSVQNMERSCLRGETKFRNFETNQTTAGLSITLLGENVATGLKIDDQIAVGKRLLLTGSAGTTRSQGNTAYGDNIEIWLKDMDFPIKQIQTSFGLALVKWKQDLGPMVVRVGLNKKQSGQISVKTSSSDQLHIALVSLIPIAASVIRMIYPGSDFKSNAY